MGVISTDDGRPDPEELIESISVVRWNGSIENASPVDIDVQATTFRIAELETIELDKSIRFPGFGPRKADLYLAKALVLYSSQYAILSTRLIMVCPREEQTKRYTRAPRNPSKREFCERRRYMNGPFCENIDSLSVAEDDKGMPLLRRDSCVV